MKHSFFLLVILILFMNRSFAQNKTFMLSLYYSINEVSSPANFNPIDSLCTALGTSTCVLSIYGYADFLNTDAYNLHLSQKRADAIKEYLLKKDRSRISIKICQGQGEKSSTDNQSKAGEPAQRRVDVEVVQNVPIKKIGTRENKTQETPKPVSTKKGIESLEKGETLTIEGLSFIPGRHMLVPSAIPILEELLTTLKEHPTLKIEIQGHICCLGPEEEDGLDYDTHENNLSETRAKAVYNYLTRNGIAAERLTYKGYGHTNPKIKIERSPDDEQVNRRVEIKILEN